MKLPFIDKMTFLLTESWRYKVLYGGRGSGKSWGIACALILLSVQKQIRVLCTRQYQSSISMSAYKLLVDTIHRLNFDRLFTITQDSIKSINGSEFYFKGLERDINAIKSIEGIDICWVEEAQDVSKSSWDTLTPTIRKEGSEIWVSFNPYIEDDATYQKFIAKPDEFCKAVKVNYYDNPWFSGELEKEMLACKERSQADYEHIWLGECLVNTDAQVFKGRYEIQDFETPVHDIFFYYGVDWGFAKDPTACVRCFLKDNKLYIDQEAYGVGVELDDTPAFLDTIPDIRNWAIKADCARPETISYMSRQGFAISGAKKWAGSIEDGLSVLKSFDKIIIHPRCKHTCEEFRLYSYKVDKNTGKILPKIEDKNNHIIDALRYALDDYIQSGTGLQIDPNWEVYYY